MAVHDAKLGIFLMWPKNEIYVVLDLGINKSKAFGIISLKRPDYVFNVNKDIVCWPITGSRSL
jgi:hypothetical protein